MIVFEIARLDGRDRSNFRCGTEALDRYVAQLVGQDVRRRLTSCFTAVEKATERIVGSYTLSAASVKVADLGQMSIKNLPRYPVLPAVKLGRLAVDREFRGKGLGSGLLSDAIRRASLGDVAAFAMIVDAKDDDAAAFYLRHNFQRYGSVPGMLMAPISDLLDR